MRRLWLLLSLLLLPLSVAAENRTEFSFLGSIPEGFEFQGWNGVTVDSSGLHIRTTADGGMFTGVDPTYSKHVIELTTLADTATDGLLLWSAPNGDLIQLPIVIPGGGTPKTSVTFLTREPQWNPHTSRIGVALPAGSVVTVRQINMVQYGLGERMLSAFKSLARTDTFQTFSINFLWGPLVGTYPQQLDNLYVGQPPIAWSAMRIVYVLLLIAIAAGMYAGFRGNKRKGWMIVTVTFVTLWLLLDVRMSAELMSYGVNDWKTYLTKPLEERIFRDRKSYYSTMEQVKPWLMEVPEYGFLSSWPVTGSMRYFTYPSLPVTPSALAEGKTLQRWFVFMSPGTAIDAQGRLTQNGIPLSDPGHVVRAFGTDACLFQVP